MTISVCNASYTAARSGSAGAVPAEPPASEGRPQHRVQRGQAQEHQAQQKGEVIGHAEQRIADGARPLHSRAEVVQRQGHTELEQGAVSKQGVVVEPEEASWRLCRVRRGRSRDVSRRAARTATWNTVQPTWPPHDQDTSWIAKGKSGRVTVRVSRFSGRGSTAVCAAHTASWTRQRPPTTAIRRPSDSISWGPLKLVKMRYSLHALTVMVARTRVKARKREHRQRRL